MRRAFWALVYFVCFIAIVANGAYWSQFVTGPIRFSYVLAEWGVGRFIHPWAAVVMNVLALSALVYIVYLAGKPYFRKFYDEYIFTRMLNEMGHTEEELY
jgi:hypothetical protein